MSEIVTDAKTVTVTCANCGRTGPVPSWLAADFNGKCPACNRPHAYAVDASVISEAVADDDRDVMRADDDGMPPAEPRDDDFFAATPTSSRPLTQSKDGAHGCAAASVEGTDDADEIPFGRKPSVSHARCGASDSSAGDGSPASEPPPFPSVSGDVASLTTACRIVAISSTVGHSHGANATSSTAFAPRHAVMTSDNLDVPDLALAMTAIVVLTAPWARKLAS